MPSQKLLDLLVCPSCKKALFYDKKADELICRSEKLAYPIIDDIPVMLIEKARLWVEKTED